MPRQKNRGQQYFFPTYQAPTRTRRWKMASYIRLSKEDLQKIKKGLDCSNSVKNQRDILNYFYGAHAEEFESIREYVRTYPGIDNRKINIDYLGDGMEYSIDPIGADPVYKKYTDGSCLKQFQFALTSKEAYDGDARTGIANSGFYQDFEEWTEQNNLNDIVPQLDGHNAIRVEVMQSGYLFSAEADLGRYQMICRVIYR